MSRFLDAQALALRLGVACLLLAAAVPSAAQEDVSYGERLDVRVVNLDVLVLGKKGQPVLDLTQDDFVVSEDGVRVDVQFFSAPGLAPEDDREWTESEDLPELELAEGPELVLFVDDEHLPSAARKRFLKDLRAFLEESEPLPPTLLLQRRGGLPISAGPTRDLDELVAAIEGAGRPLARGLTMSLARRRSLSTIEGVIESCLASDRDICSDCFGEILGEINSYAVEQTTKLERVSSGLLGAIGAMGTSRQRRTLLYAGDGLPQIPGLAMFSYLGDLCPDRRTETESEALRYRQDRLFEELGAIANAGRISLYLYDAGGLRPTTSTSVDAGGFAPSFENDSYYNQNQQAGMNLLARATGGRALVNSNRALEPMREMAQDIAARYSLGYVVDRAPTGRVHQLEVTLRGPAAKGRRLRYRRSFLDLTAEGQLIQQLNAAMYSGAVTGAFDMSVSFGEATRGESRKARLLPIEIQIPDSALTLLPAPPEGVLQGAVRLALASTDEKDRLSGFRQRILPLGEGGLLPTEEGVFSIVVRLTVPRGERIVVVAARDETTGETTVVRHEVEVP